MTNLDSILKTRDFANKGPSNQSMRCCPLKGWQVGNDALEC